MHPRRSRRNFVSLFSCLPRGREYDFWWDTSSSVCPAIFVRSVCAILAPPSIPNPGLFEQEDETKHAYSNISWRTYVFSADRKSVPSDVRAITRIVFEYLQNKLRHHIRVPATTVNEMIRRHCVPCTFVAFGQSTHNDSRKVFCRVFLHSTISLCVLCPVQDVRNDKCWLTSPTSTSHLDGSRRTFSFILLYFLLLFFCSRRLFSSPLSYRTNEQCVALRISRFSFVLRLFLLFIYSLILSLLSLYLISLFLSLSLSIDILSVVAHRRKGE